MKSTAIIPAIPPKASKPITGKTLAADILRLMIAGDPDIMREYQEWHEAWKLSPEAFFISGRTARIFLQTPDGITGLAGDPWGMSSAVGFHLLREQYTDGRVLYYALELDSSTRKVKHPVDIAEVGDKWSRVIEGERSPEYEYMGIHKRLRYELIGDTTEVRTIIAPVLP